MPRPAKHALIVPVPEGDNVLRCCWDDTIGEMKARSLGRAQPYRIRQADAAGCLHAVSLHAGGRLRRPSAFCHVFTSYLLRRMEYANLTKLPQYRKPQPALRTLTAAFDYSNPLQ